MRQAAETDAIFFLQKTAKGNNLTENKQHTKTVTAEGVTYLLSVCSFQYLVICLNLLRIFPDLHWN